MLLQGRDRWLFERIQELLPSYPDGIPPLRLADQFNPRDSRVLRKLVELKGKARKERGSLREPDISWFVETCEALEDRRRGFVRPVAKSILQKHGEGEPLGVEHVDSIAGALGQALVQDVGARVSRLRRALSELGEGEAGGQVTISRAPYRIQANSGRERKTDPSPIRGYYVLFDRPAWLHALSYRETVGLGYAQTRLRQAIGAGVAMMDDGRIEIGRGTPKSELRDPRLRNEMERVARISHGISEIFRLFYEPEATSSSDAGYVMRNWARPLAARIVIWLNASRNAILDSVNRLYEPIGKPPFTLIRGCGPFPKGWVRPGSIPKEPVLLEDEQLWAELESLRNIGLNGPDKRVA